MHPLLPGGVCGISNTNNIYIYTHKYELIKFFLTIRLNTDPSYVAIAHLGKKLFIIHLREKHSKQTICIMKT